jgi:hypothetical protein
MAIQTNNNQQFLHINKTEDLQTEIQRVKQRIKEREADLQERAKKLPVEAGKVVLGTVLPFVITSKLSNTGIGVLKTAAGLFFGNPFSKNKDHTIKEELVSTAKRIGWLTAIKTGMNLLKRKKKKE